MGGCGSKKQQAASESRALQRMYEVHRPIAPNANPNNAQRNNFYCFEDRYETLEEVSTALAEAGLEGSNLIVGVDYTASNESQGRRTFGGRNLHDLHGPGFNPYQQVIDMLGRTLSKFDEDGLIPAYGFGDITTKDRGVFPFNHGPCVGLEGVLERYREVTSTRRLSGPTSFAPIIREAIQVIKSTGYRDYHILVIIADGQVTYPEETKQAIVEASNWPLSIVMVGVGDGPWDCMETFDDDIPGRRFDNFQFVDFHQVMRSAKYPEASFALRALMEVPQQYSACKQLKILGGKINKYA